MQQQKKIKFISVMLLVIGSTIGSGIFFKNSTILSYTGSILFSLLAWTITIFAIVCICLTLKEMVKKSSQENNSLGNIGWIKSFCNTNLYLGFRNFMIYIYLPVNFFILSFYGIQSFLDSLTVFYGSEHPTIQWYYVILLAFISLIIFAFIPMHFSKYGIGQNNVLSLIKFFPLGFGVIAGFIIFITMRHGEVANNIISSSLPHPQDNVPFSLDGVSPFLGIIASIPAIFFVFDGFYTAGSLLNEMEKPEKFSSAITIGVLCIAGAYAIFSISLLISSVGGSFFGLTDAMNKNKFTKVLSFIVLFCIALSCFGTINSWAIFIFAFFKEMLQKKEIMFHNKIDFNSKFKVALFTELIIIGSFILFTLIGCFFFYNGPYAHTNYYDKTTTQIFNFCDLISNWTSLFIFIGLAIALFGYLRNNKDSSNSFKIFAYIAIFFISLSTLYEVSNSFIQLISSIVFQIRHSNIGLDVYLMPGILKVILLLAFFSVCFFTKGNKNENSNNLNTATSAKII